MKRVARRFVEDPREGPRAVESLLCYGLTRSTKADYAGALAAGLGYCRDQLQIPARRRGEAWLPEGVARDDWRRLQAALVEHVQAGGELWGSSASPYACTRVMTRAHTDKAGSPLLENTRRLEPACSRPPGTGQFRTRVDPKMLWWPGHRPTHSFGGCSPSSRRVAPLRPRYAGLSALTTAPRTPVQTGSYRTMPNSDPLHVVVDDLSRFRRSEATVDRRRRIAHTPTASGRAPRSAPAPDARSRPAGTPAAGQPPAAGG